MTDNLKQTTAIGTIWLMLDKFGQQMLYLIVGVVLARLLAVNDFTLIGMLSIFVVLSGFIIDSGFSTAIIRAKEVSPSDYSSIFLFNIFISLILYAGLFIAAPLIAAYFRQPVLVALSRFVLLALPINAFGIVQTMMLSRAMNFKLQAKINFISLIISGCTAITLSLCNFGVWALTAQSVIYSLVRVSLLWCNNTWKVSFKFRYSVLQKYWPFSSRLLVSGIANILFNNIYSVAIGRYHSPGMGYYTQANKFAEIPNVILTGPVQSAGLAAFSKVQDEPQRFIRALRKSVRTFCFISLPVFLGLICVAKPAIHIIVGTKWAEMVPFFQLICASCIFGGLVSLNNTFFNIKGFAGIVLRVEIIKLLLLVAVLPVLLPLGINAMLYGLLSVRFVVYLISGFIAGRKIHYSLSMQLRDIFPYAIISLAMFVAAWSWSFFIENNYLLLSLQLVSGVAVYVAANELLGSTVYRESKGLLLEQLKRLWN